MGGAVDCVRDALIQIILRLRDDVLREKDLGHNSSTGGESFYSSGTGLSFPSMLPSIPSVAAPLVYDQRAEGATGPGMFSSSSLYGYGSMPVCLSHGVPYGCSVTSLMILFLQAYLCFYFL